MITGTKVKLRGKRIEDGALDYQWHTDPELSDLDAVAPLRICYSDFMEEYREQLRYPSPSRRSFAIETRDGKHIGNCVYYNIDRVNRETEVGIMVGDRDYWDKGYGESAVVALVDFIYRHTGFHRVYLKTLEKNVRAQNCFRKCGFTACGRMERDGYNFLLMELARPSWKQQYARRKREAKAPQSAYEETPRNR